MNQYKIRLNQILSQEKSIRYEDYLKNRFNRYENICIFGLGEIGRYTAKVLLEKGFKIDYFCDNDKKKVGTSFLGIKCISVEELKKIENNTVVIISTRYYKEVYKQLKSLNIVNLDRVLTEKFNIDSYIEKNRDFLTKKFNEVIDILYDDESKRILCRLIEEWFRDDYKYGQLDDICSLEQYFDCKIMHLSDNEVFVDGGAYTGDTVQSFLDKCNYNFNHIFAFELNKRLFNTLKGNINKYDEKIKNRISVFDVGLSDVEDTIYYKDAEQGSCIDEDGIHKGKIINIDKLKDIEEVSFIKMDIEGSELAALTGAKNTIIKNKPKLAICIYHKPEDLFEIPLYINEICPDYKIIIRHHTDLMQETVCYAVTYDL